jgi:hypothetical protein
VVFTFAEFKKTVESADLKQGFGRTGKEMFGVNYERLVNLKGKYDPENLFDKFVDLTGA